MIQRFAIEQYTGNPPTFGVALFEVRADSWYCGQLLPRRIRKDYDFGNDRSAANMRALLGNANEWRYSVRDADGDVFGCSNSLDAAIEFARGITGARSTIADYERRLATTRIIDRDDKWRCIHELNSRKVRALRGGS